MLKTLLSLLFLIITSQAFAQDTSDVHRLRQLDYMRYANFDCDSSNGSNLEHRICLNLEFQQLDSIMNANFKELLKQTTKDSIKDALKAYQLSWVNNRRLQSEMLSEGYRGHLLGITYLHCMVESTRSRIQELEAKLNIK